ncbi:TetR family transcriptional regulator [Microbacterium sp. AG790]|uniref:TetR/AcrR family transcriptional regulator n=1 Tax=Microbacterium sp. AG790 TaxID=2183995 RepID=UPI000EAFDE6F|nr:TetR family transcriptional regulator [Microbacterium sp. AG790]RKS90060.1 TetR family transcriptional regulator [Microbacterium sp. AG790]
MAATAPRKRRARGSVEPEKILDGAFEIAAEKGLDGLSMPDLAAQLDVGVTSIYWYFRSKDELLRQMSARAMSQMQQELPRPDGRDPQMWRQFMEEYTLAQRELHRDHNLLTELLIIRLNTYGRRATIAAFERIESILGFLVEAGFTRAAAWQVISSYSLYIRGFILTEYHRDVNKTPPEGPAQLSLLAPEGMPLMSELITEDDILLDMSGEESLSAGMAMLGDGAEALLHRLATSA